MNREKHPLAGKTVSLKLKGEDAQGLMKTGDHYRLEDWWENVSGKSWQTCQGNPACLQYAMRTGLAKEPIPSDNEVVYGKVGSFGHLVHISELGKEVTASD